MVKLFVPYLADVFNPSLRVIDLLMVSTLNDKEL